MVRALVATMLKVGAKKTSISLFQEIIQARDCTKATFSVPGKGLFLTKVGYPEKYFK
jgi:tRNA pseudouridine38-40 synthase